MADDMLLRRRTFLAGGVAAGAALMTPGFLRDALAAGRAGRGPYGELQPVDANGLMLPPGFRSRQIAQGGQPVPGTNYPWHFAPDGQAAYRTSGGGYVLVQNSEAPAPAGGGSSSLLFSPKGEIVGAQRVLSGTNLNCGGGPTPWGTWLSGEEHEGGLMWEADPLGLVAGVPRPALGTFSHEAAAVDPVGGHVYLTEDQPDGLLYRFAPAREGDLTTGVLQAAVVGEDGHVTWQRVPDPNLVTQGRRTREQVPGATRFRGGEGLWHHEGIVYFTTKGDRRVWAYDVVSSRLQVLYDPAQSLGAALDAVDNVTVAPSGDVYVCEDGGNMEICLITPEGEVAPFVRLAGRTEAEHKGSEMTGVVFDPSGRRMYFSSQRAFPWVPGTPVAAGATYEVTGPFRLPPGGVPDSWVHTVGRPDEVAEDAPLAVRARQVPAGLAVEVEVRQAGLVHLALRSSDLRTEPWHAGGPDRPVAVTLAARRVGLTAGTHRIDLPVRVPRGVGATLVAVTSAGGMDVAVGVPVRLPAASLT